MVQECYIVPSSQVGGAYLIWNEHTKNPYFTGVYVPNTDTVWKYKFIKTKAHAAYTKGWYWEISIWGQGMTLLDQEGHGANL